MNAMLFFLIAAVFIIASFSGNQHVQNHRRPMQTYPPGMFSGYDYDREYYQYRREQLNRRLIATLLFTIALVAFFVMLGRDA